MSADAKTDHRLRRPAPDRRRPVYQHEVANGLPAGIALDDGVAARYDDERLVEIVSARPGGRAFRVDRTGERALDVRTIG